ncbi:unnamed protein product [Peniophora sp. CBMAI 1063]|nr:unnamed protein product [Peniophora sp. CBMAI 1063]
MADLANALTANPRPSTPQSFTRHLPEDVLAIIFRLVIDEHYAHSDAPFQPCAPQLVLASVCSQWRELSRSMRHLWTTVPVGADPSHAAQCLIRSGELHLRVGVQFSVHPWSSDRSEPDLINQVHRALYPFTWHIKTKLPVNRIFLVKRVREVAMSVPPSLVSRFHTQGVWRRHYFPDVRTLYVSLKKTRDEVSMEAAAWLLERWLPTSPYDLSWAGPRLFPKLHHLRLDGLHLPQWSLRLPSNLHTMELHLIDAPQRKLQKLDHNSISLSHLWDDLGSLAHLNRLSIDFADAFSGVDIIADISLPSIHEINLTTQSLSLLSNISKATRMPSLRRYTLALTLRHRSVLDPPAGDEIVSSLRCFISQLPPLHALYVLHRTSTRTAIVTVAAASHFLDWPASVAQDALFDDTNLHITFTCDVRSRCASTAETFLGAALECMASLSDTHPIDSLEISLDDDHLTTFVCSPGVIGRFQKMQKLTCHDGHAELISNLLQNSTLLPHLKTLATSSLDPVGAATLDALSDMRKGLSHLTLPNTDILRDGIR